MSDDDTDIQRQVDQIVSRGPGGAFAVAGGGHRHRGGVVLPVLFLRLPAARGCPVTGHADAALARESEQVAVAAERRWAIIVGSSAARGRASDNMVSES